MSTPTDTMSDSVRVPRSALAWLFGEESDEAGRWFEKEKFPEATGAYWWRSVFRNKIKAAAPAPAADDVYKAAIVAFHGEGATHHHSKAAIIRAVDAAIAAIPHADVREAVLKEAAKLCDQMERNFLHDSGLPSAHPINAQLAHNRANTCALIASQIRALVSRPAIDEVRLREILADKLLRRFHREEATALRRGDAVEDNSVIGAALAAMRAATGG